MSFAHDSKFVQSMFFQRWSLFKWKKLNRWVWCVWCFPNEVLNLSVAQALSSEKSAIPLTLLTLVSSYFNHEREKTSMSNSTRIVLVISKSQLEKYWLRAWVSTGSKGAWHLRNFCTVMSGTRWFWQFYYIIKFWGFTSDWHPLFQIPNSSPVDCNKNKSTLGKSMTRTITMKKKIGGSTYNH
jgi:hypothetical protein